MDVFYLMPKRKPMKLILKNILSGLMLGVITVSLILSPVPGVSVSYAQSADYEECFDPDKHSQKERLYKKGCDLDDIKKKAKFSNYTDHNSNIMAMLEQAVAGMMGVVMIQAMSNGYLYEVDPTLYGNDCSANKAGKYTIRIAQLGSLAYILGDIKANMDFSNASEMSLDAVSSKEVSTTEADYKNKQIETYDRLIEVFEKQKKGVKTKQTLSLLAEAAYGASLGLEIAGIFKCNAQCAKDKAMKKAQIAKVSTAAAAAIKIAAAKVAKASVCPGPTCNPAAVTNCNATIASMTGLMQLFSASVTEKEAADAAKGAAKVAKQVKKTAFWTGLWAKVKNFFKSESAGINAVGKLPVEDLADDAIKGVVFTEEQARMITEFTTDQTNLAAVVANTQICSKFDIPLDGPALEASVKSALNAYVNYKNSPIECCGGSGMTIQQQNSLYAHNTVLAAELNTLVGEPSIGLNAKIAMGKATEKAQVAAMQKGFDQFADQIDIGGSSNLFNPFSAVGEAQVIRGTLKGYGVPPTSLFSTTKDMRVFGLFGGAEEGTSGIKDRDFKYYVKKNFESTLIRLALLSQLESFDAENPQKELEEIASLYRKVEKTKHLFNQFVEQESSINLAKAEYKNKALWKQVVSEVSELIMPSAHAWISSVGGQVAAGAGLKMVKSKLGLKGPWSAVLGVGADFMIMNALLGNYARNYGLVSPKGRAYTWGAMAAINLAVYMMDKKAEGKIKSYISAVKAHKERYVKEAGFSKYEDGDKSSETRDGSGRLKTKNGSPYNRYVSNGVKIKACAVPKAEGFAPSTCPTKVPKSKFALPKIDRALATSVTPAHLASAGLVSKVSRGLATGSSDSSSLGSMDLAKIEKQNKAMRTFNAKAMEKLDKQEEAKNKDKKFTSAPLAGLIAKAKKAIVGGSKVAGIGQSLAVDSSSNRKDESIDGEAVKGVVKSSAFGGFANPTSKSVQGADYDMNLFDESGDEVVDTTTDEELEKFVLNHDDIHKTKQTSIFKILSNRYLLSYPKVLEEK
tara:strand:+ start:35509 stop:38580 length:3072 start_codon:yes stop_codon:yes gene_type:complete